jgi:nitroreductase
MTCREIIVAVARPDLWKQTNDNILAHLHAARPAHYDYLVTYHTKSIPFAYDRGPLNIRGAIKAFINWCIGWKTPVGRGGFFPWRLRETAVGSTAIACQTFMLAMTHFGYDTCPMGGFDEVRLRKLLKLPRAAVPVMGIAVGKRAPNNVTTEQYRLGYRDKVVEL